MKSPKIKQKVDDLVEKGLFVKDVFLLVVREEGVSVDSEMGRFYQRHKEHLSSRETTALGEERSDPACLGAMKIFVDSVEKFMMNRELQSVQMGNCG